MIRILTLTVFFVSLIAINLSAQHHMNPGKKHKSMMGCFSGHENHDSHSDQIDATDSIQHKHSEKKSDTIEKNPIIREGLIDIPGIDQNQDGFVYQCPMDWNVISDKSERCPICEMKLKKVSIEKARENLQKHGFKVKE